VKKSLTILFTIAALLLQGCGSVVNLVSEDPQNYGGIDKDRDWLRSHNNMCLKAPPGGGVRGAESAAAAFLLIPTLYATEFTLSFALDTLALPYTKFRTRVNHPDDTSLLNPVESVVHVPSADGTRLSTGD